jgi:hypothetical protein
MNDCFEKFPFRVEQWPVRRHRRHGTPYGLYSVGAAVPAVVPAGAGPLHSYQL